MKKHFKVSLVAVIGQFILTTAHHIYGAMVFNTPWRMHIIPPALIALAVAGLFYYLFTRKGNKTMFVLYALTAGIFFGILIGGYEGIYNHLLKNILFFGGVGTAMMETLFPPPTYEMPSEFIFEFSGIMQGLPGVIIIYSLLRAYKSLRVTANDTV